MGQCCSYIFMKSSPCLSFSIGNFMTIWGVLVALTLDYQFVTNFLTLGRHVATFCKFCKTWFQLSPRLLQTQKPESDIPGEFHIFVVARFQWSPNFIRDKNSWNEHVVSASIIAYKYSKHCWTNTSATQQSKVIFFSTHTGARKDVCWLRTFPFA